MSQDYKLTVEEKIIVADWMLSGCTIDMKGYGAFSVFFSGKASNTSFSQEHKKVAEIIAKYSMGRIMTEYSAKYKDGLV